jgi:hypothetical protein
MVHTAEVGFEGQNDPAYQWKIGQRYTISGNGGPTMTVHVHGVYDAGTAGLLSVHYSKNDKFENVTPIAGQTLTDPDGITTVATLTSEIYDLYIPGQNIVGYDNPEYGLDVDITGSANIRFAEGLPQLDAWGKLRTSGATQLGDYVFGQEAILTENFAPVELDGGYVTYSNTRHSITVGVDHTVNPTNGFASSSSSQYHHYIAGSSHLYAATTLINAPATTGNVRRWGLFDANNGFLFQLGTGGDGATDATGFCVVVRNNIPEAAQKDTVIVRSDWNGDKLDGTGDSQATLDLSQANLWWIDIQWHGAGRVRFGTYIDGQRVICHSYYQGNRYAIAMSQSASLPVCYAVATTPSASTNLYIESWSAAVWTESDIDLRVYGAPATYASTHSTVADGPNWQRLFALSPRELHANGEVNHTVYVPTSIKGYAFLDDGTPALMDVKMEVNSIDQGASFSSVASTNVDLDTSGTSYQAGRIILQDIFRGEYNNVLTDTFNNFQYGAVKNLPDDGGTVENTIATIDTSTPAVMTVTGRLNAREPQTVTFPKNAGGYLITGTDNANYNGNTYYVKPTGVTTAELYTDSGLSSPVNGTTEGAATGGNIKGFQGSRVVWTFYARANAAQSGIKTLMLIVNWKEIVQ